MLQGLEIVASLMDYAKTEAHLIILILVTLLIFRESTKHEAMHIILRRKQDQEVSRLSTLCYYKTGLSEHVWTYSCISSISKNSLQPFSLTQPPRVTSGFLRNIHENCTLLNYYIQLVPSSRVNNPTEP
jgi:hypothetical protein